MVTEEPAKEAPGLIEQLQEAIRQSGRSLTQLAIDAGVGSNQLSRFMRGKRTLTLETAEKVCRVLQLQLTSYAKASTDRPQEPPAAEKTPGKKGRPRKPQPEQPAAEPAEQPPADQGEADQGQQQRKPRRRKRDG